MSAPAPSDAMELIEKLFGCKHKNKTRPITLNHAQTYVVCLDCGKEFGYDLLKMREVPRNKEVEWNSRRLTN